MGPSSVQDGVSNDFFEKSGFSRNITFSNGFGWFFAQHGDPKRPKIAPRRVQDRLGSVFLTIEFSLRFCIVFDSVLVPIWPPKWLPRGARELG